MRLSNYIKVAQGILTETCGAHEYKMHEAYHDMVMQFLKIEISGLLCSFFNSFPFLQKFLIVIIF